MMSLVACGESTSAGDNKITQDNNAPVGAANEDYFEWSGDYICGLTSKGLKQTKLVIPARCIGFYFMGSYPGFVESKVEEVYSSGVKYGNLEYQYYEQNGGLFILAWEKEASYYENNGNNALIRVDAVNKSSSVVEADVTNVVFAENGNEIFFKTNNDDYHFLKQYDIASNAVSTYTSFDKTFEPKFVANGRVYITQAHDYGSSTDVMVSIISNKSGFETLYSYTDTADLSVTPDALAVVVIKSNVITLIDSNGNTKTITDENAKTINVIDYTNGCILYYDTTDENSNIKLVSYYNAVTGGDCSIKTLTTISTIEEGYAYFDYNDGENYLYFINKANANYYLNRIKVNNNLEEKEEMFGVYLQSDIPVVEEEPEIEEE
jgi:hypothetical protein